MAKRILVPLDGSPQGWAAFEFALAEFPGAEVTALHVIDPVEGGYSIRSGFPRSSEEWYEDEQAEAEALVEEAHERAGQDVTVRSVVEVGRPSRVIVEHANEEGFDQLILGSHGRSGVSRILLGSVAETVVRRATIPVTVVR